MSRTRSSQLCVQFLEDIPFYVRVVDVIVAALVLALSTHISIGHQHQSV